MWEALRQLVLVRNLIVHSVWAMLYNALPISISYRLSSDTGHVVGEPFDLERLQAVERQCFRVKKVLDGLSERLHAAAPPSTNDVKPGFIVKQPNN